MLCFFFFFLFFIFYCYLYFFLHFSVITETFFKSTTKTNTIFVLFPSKNSLENRLSCPKLLLWRTALHAGICAKLEWKQEVWQHPRRRWRELCQSNHAIIKAGKGLTVSNKSFKMWVAWAIALLAVSQFAVNTMLLLFWICWFLLHILPPPPPPPPPPPHPPPPPLLSLLNFFLSYRFTLEH